MKKKNKKLTINPTRPIIPSSEQSIDFNNVSHEEQIAIFREHAIEAVHGLAADVIRLLEKDKKQTDAQDYPLSKETGQQIEYLLATVHYAQEHAPDELLVTIRLTMISDSEQYGDGLLTWEDTLKPAKRVLESSTKDSAIQYLVDNIEALAMILDDETISRAIYDRLYEKADTTSFTLNIQ